MNNAIGGFARKTARAALPRHEKTFQGERHMEKGMWLKIGLALLGIAGALGLLALLSVL